jgi:hypothetical protein
MIAINFPKTSIDRLQLTVEGLPSDVRVVEKIIAGAQWRRVDADQPRRAR